MIRTGSCRQLTLKTIENVKEKMGDATVSAGAVNEISVNDTVAAVLSEFHIKRTKNGTEGFPQ